MAAPRNLRFIVPIKEIDRLIELGYLFKKKRVGKRTKGPEEVVLSMKLPELCEYGKEEI